MPNWVEFDNPQAGLNVDGVLWLVTAEQNKLSFSSKTQVAYEKHYTLQK